MAASKQPVDLLHGVLGDDGIGLVTALVEGVVESGWALVEISLDLVDLLVQLSGLLLDSLQSCLDDGFHLALLRLLGQ